MDVRCFRSDPKRREGGEKERGKAGKRVRKSRTWQRERKGRREGKTERTRVTECELKRVRREHQTTLQWCLVIVHTALTQERVMMCVK